MGEVQARVLRERVEVPQYLTARVRVREVPGASPRPARLVVGALGLTQVMTVRAAVSPSVFIVTKEAMLRLSVGSFMGDRVEQ